MTNDTPPMFEMTEEQKAENLQLANHMAKVFGMGQGEVHLVSDEDLKRVLDTKGNLKLRRRFESVAGRAISSASEVELALNPLLTFILNPTDPGRARPAVLGLMASGKIRMLRDLIDPKWTHGKLLISHLEAVSSYRNRLAHSTWSVMRFGDDGKPEFGHFPTGFRIVKGSGWQERSDPITLAELRQRTLDAEVLAVVLQSYLYSLGSQQYAGSNLVTTPDLGELTTIFWGNSRPTPSPAWRKTVLLMFPFDESILQAKLSLIDVVTRIRAAVGQDVPIDQIINAIQEFSTSEPTEGDPTTAV